MSLVLKDETPPAGYERLIYVEEKNSGLRAFICVHSTACGPAAGGCRMWDYPSLDDARTDALRLAEGMTFKNAAAGLGLGGGKSVIIGNPKTDKSDALFRAFGQAVHSLGGQYYTAEDVGIGPDDMAIVATQTPYAVGLEGGEFASGDPSPFTAEGVFQCLLVGANDAFGTEDLSGKVVLVQGLGHVGMSLARKLYEASAKLIVSDVNLTALDFARTKFGATVCDPDRVFEQDMDILAPCALGGVLTAESVAKLTAKVVCGAANNQLATPETAGLLKQRGISYLPDYIVNAGGIISVAGEIHKRGTSYREARLHGIAERIRDILDLSKRNDKTTVETANDIVKDIIANAKEQNNVREFAQ